MSDQEKALQQAGAALADHFEGFIIVTHKKSKDPKADSHTGVMFVGGRTMALGMMEEAKVTLMNWPPADLREVGLESEEEK
jgi:hypothetical protein